MSVPDRRRFSRSRHAWLTVLVAGALAIGAGVARGQPASLERQTAIYDPVRQRMIMFGGYNGTRMVSDVWELTLGTAPQWTLLSPTGAGPSPRLGHAAVYDPVRDRMIVYGGLDSTGVLGDVWELSLSDPPVWTPLFPTGILPNARRYHSAIYDPVRDRVVFFGGSNGFGAPTNEAWSLWLSPDPRWEVIQPAGFAPAARFNHSAIYDPVRDCMVMFGGGLPAFKDTWELSLGDTPAWTLLHPPDDPRLKRLGHTAIYDPVGDRMLVFGGNDGNQPFDDTWQLSRGSSPAWTVVPAAGPPSARAFHAAVVDTTFHRMIIFGGFPNVTETTWGLLLDDPKQWSPNRPVISATPNDLQLPTVTVGDTVSVPFLVSNVGLQPLQITALDPPDQGMQLSPPGPYALAWGAAVNETLLLAAMASGTGRDSVVVLSSDPITPRLPLNVSTDVRGLDFDTHGLGDPTEVMLGTSFIVVITPRPGVRIEQGMLYYSIGGMAVFDSIPLTPLASDFIAAIPASAVTERGVDYFVRVDNSGFHSWQPANAPTTLFTQAVARPTSITAIPRPTSGSEFLAGRAVDVEVLLPDGAEFLSGTMHYRRGGESVYQSAALAPGALGLPFATIPDTIVGPRGVEYWTDVQTYTSTLRFPVGTQPALIRTKVSSLAEETQHSGGRYRLLTVPLDFGADFTGTLADLLADQFGPYDNTRWRAYWYDPLALANVEFAASAAARFRPEPGRAFWLVTRDAHRVDTNPVEGVSTSTGGEVPIALEAGWNMFGNPFDFPVAWSSVRRNAATVANPVAFDPSLGTIGDYAAGAPSTLVPFEGYFVHATQAETLWVPPVAAASSAILSADSSPATSDPKGTQSESFWLDRLRASTGRASDGSNEFGIGSVDGPIEARQWPKPPPPPGEWVRVAFVHPEWPGGAGEYRRDIRPAGSAGETWDIEVRSGPPGAVVTIELSAIVPPQSGVVTRLIDRETGEVIDASSYRILSLRERAYRLAIVAGSAEYVASAIQGTDVAPARVTLDQNAPNPCRDATRVRFGLPRADGVSLEVFSVLGQRIAAPLERAQLPAGYHSVVWDGRTSSGERAAAGVYLLRLTAGNVALTRRLVRLP